MLLLYHSTSLQFQFSEKTCTLDYPFAYRDGEYCCKTNRELVNGGNSNEIASGACDGIGFSKESTCCKDHEYLLCPHSEGCYDNGSGMYCMNRQQEFCRKSPMEFYKC